MSRPLLGLLGAYDGRHTDVLEAILSEGVPDDRRIVEAIELATCDDPNLADGATWLVRAWAERGAAPTGEVLASLIDALPDVASPWARLHLCQAIRSLELPAELTEAVVAFAQECRGSERPFLRAWAMDALAAVAEAHPAFDEVSRAALAEAFDDPAASVRARARRLSG